MTAAPLWRSAIRATLRCLTGCAIGEVLGMVLAIAFVSTVPANRALIARGRGHAVVHELHGH